MIFAYSSLKDKHRNYTEVERWMDKKEKLCLEKISLQSKIFKQHEQTLQHIAPIAWSGSSIRCCRGSWKKTKKARKSQSITIFLLRSGFLYAIFPF